MGIACLFVLTACVPVPEAGIDVVPTTVTTPQWPDAADPFVLLDGGRYHVFSSDTFWGGNFRMPVRTVDDLTRVYSPQEWVDVTVEGMPQAPVWSVGDGLFWAPTVARAADGQWFLHATFDNTDFNVWAFGLDPNLDQPRDAYGLGGYWPVPVFWRTQPWEGYVMENPAMVRDPYSGSYALAYSAVDLWFRPTHAVGVARCAGPLGGCVTAPNGPWIVQGSVGTGPGGLSFFTDRDGALRVVYASWPPGGEYSWPRLATVAAVRDVATRPTLVPLTR